VAENQVVSDALVYLLVVVHAQKTEG